MRAQTQETIVVRIGAGLRPSYAVTVMSRRQGNELDVLTVNDIETLNTEGDLTKIRDYIVGLPGDTDVAVDLSESSAFGDMLPNTYGTACYRILSGDTIEEQNEFSRQYTIGRRTLLSHMNGHLSRAPGLKFNTQGHWPEAQKALQEVTETWRRQDAQEGLALVDTTSSDDLALTIVLAVWRATQHTKGGWEANGWPAWNVSINT